MSETEQTDANLLLTALKELLKPRGITYADLAEHMNVSLPTVKRLLNKSTIPLDRLLSICRIADIDPQELFERSQKIRPTHTQFTDEQDALFDRHPCMLAYFSELFYERRRPGEIARKHGLDKISTDLYLAELEKIGLLERQPGGRVTFLVSPPMGFGPNSKVLRRMQKQFMESIVENVINPNEEDRAQDGFAILKPLRLSDTTWRELLGELTDLVDRFSFLSEKSPSDGPDSWQLAIAAGPASTDEHSHSQEWNTVCRISPKDFRNRRPNRHRSTG